MVKDAEVHADEDKRKREEAEERNKLESLIYESEKNIQEHGSKVNPAIKAEVEKEIDNAKQALESGNAENYRQATVRLGNARTRIGTAIYEALQKEQAASGAHQQGSQGDGHANYGSPTDAPPSDGPQWSSGDEK